MLKFVEMHTVLVEFCCSTYITLSFGASHGYSGCYNPISEEWLLNVWFFFAMDPKKFVTENLIYLISF